MSKMVSELNSDTWENFYSIYNILCKWVHCNPLGFNDFLDEKNNTFIYIEKDPSAELIYNTVYFCFYMTSYKYNAHFKLNENSALKKFETEFMNIINQTTKSP